MNNNETIADICKEAEARFRELLEKHVDSSGHIQAMQQFNQVFDRIEAAAKRDCEDAERRGNHAATKAICETIEKVGPLYDAESVGNAAKLREAVKAVVDVGYPHNFQQEAPHIRGYCYDITRAIDKCFAALASPSRNCDVGSAKEQGKRFDEFIDKHWMLGKTALEWAQMPYNEGENKENFPKWKGGAK